ncbi:hypothetical protein DdX_21639 [Ditylenchus destructor]|uniref:Uncharacterized protein n=1 Tax=Ditylenchus destructor TaxID=166010 RepID=A0AAD4QV40_9BILA|nr:hypothetical protein DdX_21639 [Ditylenchus destructor]
MAAHHFAQTRRVAAGRQLGQLDLALLHQAHDLLMVHQFFTGQARHQVDQVDVGMVLGDQAQGGAGGLEFTVLVVDQQGFLVGQRGLDPAVGGAATEEFVDFWQVHRLTGKESQKGPRLYRPRRRPPATGLDVHQHDVCRAATIVVPRPPFLENPTMQAIRSILWSSSPSIRKAWPSSAPS